MQPPSHPAVKHIGGDPGGSVTEWIGELKSGHPAAADRLWRRYFWRMAGLARKRMGGHQTPAADEEDVALSAFRSFCQGADSGKFARLAGRDDLWSLLAAITSYKAIDQLARERRVKRGGRAEREELHDLDQLVGPAPPPDAAAEADDDLRRLLERIDDPALRDVARLRLEGYAVDEIATRLGCAPRTVDRKLRIVRYLLAGGGRLL